MKTVSQVMTALKKAGTEQTRKTFARHGAPENFFGVKVGDLKVIAKQIKGDQELASRLNLDESLNTRIVDTDLIDQKDGIIISPDSKKQHTTIRTNYLLPTKDQFDAIDTLAKHVKSIW